jgi:hypothetical protein
MATRHPLWRPLPGDTAQVNHAAPAATTAVARHGVDRRKPRLALGVKQH